MTTRPTWTTSRTQDTRVVTRAATVRATSRVVTGPERAKTSPPAGTPRRPSKGRPEHRTF